MPLVAENGFFFKFSHRGSGYATGPTETLDHNVATAEFSVHVGLSRVQATTGGPVEAVIGIMRFGGADFGPDPGAWEPLAYGRVQTWTIATRVTKGDITAWEFFQIWQ